MATDLPFPTSLPEFMRLFPDDVACAKYLEADKHEGNEPDGLEPDEGTNNGG